MKARKLSPIIVGRWSNDFLDNMTGNQIISPFRVDHDIKINVEKYGKFKNLQYFFLVIPTIAERFYAKNCIYMSVNTFSHYEKLSIAQLTPEQKVTKIPN